MRGIGVLPVLFLDPVTVARLMQRAISCPSTLRCTDSRTWRVCDALGDAAKAKAAGRGELAPAVATAASTDNGVIVEDTAAVDENEPLLPSVISADRSEAQRAAG
jgi:hypothetical protein